MNELESTLRRACGYFDTGATHAVVFRAKALRRVARIIEDHERDLLAILHAKAGFDPGCVNPPPR